MAWPFVSAGAHAPHSDERLGPTPSRGSSHSARRLRSLAFLGSSGDCRKMAYQLEPDFRSYSRRDNRHLVDYVTVDATQKTDEKTTKMVFHRTKTTSTLGWGSDGELALACALRL